jgi:Papain-like cysteine protease AvrRpt2
MPFKKVLPVPRITQEKNRWCWAASADMVADYYRNPELTQCNFANKLLDRTDCCKDKLETCNEGCTAEDVAEVYQQFNIESHFTEGQVSPERLVAEIDADRPVQVGFRWRGGPGGHVVIVTGHGRDQQGVFFGVNDPLDKYHEMTNGKVYYDSLKDAYGLGEWAWTWTGIQPNAIQRGPMVYTDPIPQKNLSDITKQISEAIRDTMGACESNRDTMGVSVGIRDAMGEKLAPDAAIELGQSLSISMLGVNKIKGPNYPDLHELVEDTGRWHHQVKSGGKGVAVLARSAASGEIGGSHSIRECFPSRIPESIDKAIDWVNQHLKQNLVVRLLSVPAYQVDALWLYDESKHESQVLIIDAPKEFTNLERSRLLTSQEFLEALGKNQAIIGISSREPIPTTTNKEDRNMGTSDSSNSPMRVIMGDQDPFVIGQERMADKMSQVENTLHAIDGKLGYLVTLLQNIEGLLRSRPNQQ